MPKPTSNYRVKVTVFLDVRDATSQREAKQAALQSVKLDVHAGVDHVTTTATIDRPAVKAAP